MEDFWQAFRPLNIHGNEERHTMYYSSFGILAIVLHFIINHNIIRNGRKGSLSKPAACYRHYLASLLVFYCADVLWGFLVDLGIRAIAYADTMIFFLSMAFSILLWTRYVVAFIDKKGMRSNALLFSGWGIFCFVVVALIINFFNPFIFMFTKDTVYVPGFGRYLLMGLLFLLFLLLSGYSFIVAKISEGRDKIHYMAVGLSGFVMAVLIVFQTLDAFAPFFSIGCLIANCLIHIYVEEDEKIENHKLTAEVKKEKERYSQISASLATDYEAIYYISIETGQYMEVSYSKLNESMKIPHEGADFYSETRENIDNYVHPDDRAFASSMYYKDVRNLEGRKSYSYEYRIMVGDEARYFRFMVMLSEDGKHFVLCVKDIQDTITAETAMLEKQRLSVTFSRIAESLASNYDVIYYVDTQTGEYVGYTSKNIYGGLKVNESGEDFFEDAKRNATGMVHPQDVDKVVAIFDKDYMLTILSRRKQLDFKYRLIVNERIQHTRMSARKSSDNFHMIICVESIEDEVKKENEHLRALNSEKELARRDELTGVRNKTAFTELEQSLQESIDTKNGDTPFALVVCDLNDLKKINDTMGHNAGDEYIISAAKLLCDVFAHSPVFRIGGDEFAVYLKGDDFEQRKQYIDRLRETAVSNKGSGKGPVLAVGMAEYDPSFDSDIKEIFDRADRFMYEHKRNLKKDVVKD